MSFDVKLCNHRKRAFTSYDVLYIEFFMNSYHMHGVGTPTLLLHMSKRRDSPIGTDVHILR